MNPTDRVFIAGHRGLVGSAICRRLSLLGYGALLTRSRDELELTDREQVRAFFREERPQFVFLAAARVGGIHANTTYPAEFIRDNLLVQVTVIDAAHEFGVEKLLFLGSSCIYPRASAQPIPEDALLSGPLEPTNEPYAIAKIAGIITCQSYNRQYGTRFISAMPTNLYGEHDNFDRVNSHVVPGLIRRFHEAKVANAPNVEVWGTGAAQREFLHADDFADAAVHLMQVWGEGGDDVNQIVNVGYGSDVSIRELVWLVRDVVGYRGEVRWDATKPDGMPRKLLDSSRIRATGWEPRVTLRDGLERTYRWYAAHERTVRQ